MASTSDPLQSNVGGDKGPNADLQAAMGLADQPLLYKHIREIVWHAVETADCDLSKAFTEQTPDKKTLVLEEAYKEASYLKQEKYLWGVECLASEAIRRKKEGKISLESDTESEGEQTSEGEESTGEGDSDSAEDEEKPDQPIDLQHVQWDDDDEEDLDYLPGGGGY